ncbi:hypothetical protein B0A78_07420 [Flavobacterium columnare NBRC 100251 = ATCC 23463]|uniref:Rieske domain-containing protein n=1 Tax=Flavobacterium columnare (strain ATCC 49512 / CIP 103533 / TG 44/87) TaxID=1041826 RepID=G8X520_FLACA|nr:hypothetical protein [Flavobacterium columnare]AEW86836.1 hypothetical protein FCOL_10135 [Flavobacterium columnare ATCC 49512]ANO47259.1 hypothetical protein Pf1_01802 [Flavobacterium columnare]APT22073.1 hypothetical protein BU993_05145 [Flavobacterium columnare]MBF6652854.1 hypothetical protein [Flavobacterium columnare]MBF6655838.1 hypothetical protein [Flavobacterium columnare]
MKKYFLIIILILVFGCDKNNVVNSANPYLANNSFSIDLNPSLPSYNKLNYPGEPLLIAIPGVGIQGILVMKTGGAGDFVAWEASCPLQYPTDCSKLNLKGISAQCTCDNSEFNLYTGDGGKQYPLKRYNVQNLNGIIRIYN